jgi:predicted nucleic acid-binding protein
LIVIDASAVICALLNSPADRAAAVSDRIADEDLHAPHLIDVEVAQTARRLVLAGRLPALEAADALEELARTPILRYPHYPHFERIWQIRANFSAYDACYVALAELLDAPLITLDARMSRAGSNAQIEVF